MPSFLSAFSEAGEGDTSPVLSESGRELVAYLVSRTDRTPSGCTDYRRDPILRRPPVSRCRFGTTGDPGRRLYKDYCAGCHGGAVEVGLVEGEWQDSSGTVIPPGDTWRVYLPESGFLDLETETSFSVEGPGSPEEGVADRGFRNPVAFLRGEAFLMLDPKPRDFSLGVFKFRSTLEGFPALAGDVFRTVSMGVPGTSMPAYASLSEADRWALVDFVRGLSPVHAQSVEREKKEGSPVPEDAIVRVPKRGTRRPEDLVEDWEREGLAQYVFLGCWRCHGRDRNGKGPDSEGLLDTWGFPCPPFAFTGQKPWKCGGRPEDVYRTVITGLPGTPMPSFAGDSLFSPPREDVENVDPLYRYFPVKTLHTLRVYSRTLPTARELAVWPEESRAAAAERRRWALVDYVLSR